MARIQFDPLVPIQHLLGALAPETKLTGSLRKILNYDEIAECLPFSRITKGQLELLVQENPNLETLYLSEII